MVEIQMVNYKIPENIRFEFDPQKLGVSYSIMSGRWLGGMRMASGGPAVFGYSGENETIYGVVSCMTVICMMWWGNDSSSLVGLVQ